MALVTKLGVVLIGQLFRLQRCPSSTGSGSSKYSHCPNRETPLLVWEVSHSSTITIPLRLWQFSLPITPKQTQPYPPPIDTHTHTYRHTDKLLCSTHRHRHTTEENMYKHTHTLTDTDTDSDTLDKHTLTHRQTPTGTYTM